MLQQLADKIRAAGHVAAEDVQSCVENFRVDDDVILKVRGIVSVARRKFVPRGCALMTPRVALPAVWLHARAPGWWLCAWGGRAGRLAACARIPCASCGVQGAHVRARYICMRRTFALLFPAGLWCVQQARPRQSLL